MKLNSLLKPEVKPSSKFTTESKDVTFSQIECNAFNVNCLSDWDSQKELSVKPFYTELYLSKIIPARGVWKYPGSILTQSHREMREREREYRPMTWCDEAAWRVTRLTLVTLTHHSHCLHRSQKLLPQNSWNNILTTKLNSKERNNELWWWVVGGWPTGFSVSPSPLWVNLGF